MDFYLLLVVFILFNSINIFSTAGPHWNYGELGPDVWADLYPTCGGNAQSPINIKTACTTYQTFESFQFSSAYDLKQDFIVTNDGHTIVGTQINASVFPLTLSGGGLSDIFIFKNFHLHWGENYHSGSEHQM
jgi:carbonic anhydrase